jgi:hypothetical protein
MRDIELEDSIEYYHYVFEYTSCWRISICNYKSLLRHFSQAFSQTHYVFEYYNGARNYEVQKKAQMSKLGRPALLLNGVDLRGTHPIVLLKEARLNLQQR